MWVNNHREELKCRGVTSFEDKMVVGFVIKIKAVKTYFYVIAMSVFCSLFLTKIDFKSVFSASIQ